jgi:hypothetical protein
MMKSLAVLAASLALASAAVPADQVTNIPGYGAPLSNLYSGYVNAGTGKHHHYVYSESLNNPKTDPVVLWFNGKLLCTNEITI